MIRTSILAALCALAALSAIAQSQPAVEVLPSGVRVEHVLRGQGPAPAATDKVTVHYRGTLTDGTEFDSSYQRGVPARFSLQQVIPCWTQGLQKMAEGGTAVLTCPANTAYGNRAVGNIIKPNSELRFQVELLAVN